MEHDTAAAVGHGRRLKTPAEAEVLVAGLVRNCSNSLRADVARLKTALADFGRVQWLLVESDSSDDSIAVLRELARSEPGFSYASLGPLQATLPLRTERIARCRNEYLARLRNDPRYRDVDYVLVADFDGVNSMIDAASIRSCWQRHDWDACMANQRGPYYDVWALRHPVWSPNDCWDHHRFLSRYCRITEWVLYQSVHARMIRIPPDTQWIEVESAFGGLALYRRAALEDVCYDGLDDAGRLVCEHIALHRQMRQRGHRLFVNPGLINAAYTPHTNELRWHRRVNRILRNMARSVTRRHSLPQGT